MEKLVLSLIFAFVYANELQCIQLLNQLYFEYQTVPQLLLAQTLPYINLSGKGNQQYGFYDECLRDGNHYSTTIIQPNTGGTLYYGICHSKECESNDLMSKTAQTLIKTILDSTGIPKALGIDVFQSNISFIDPQTHYPELGFGTYATIGIILLLVVFSSLDFCFRIIFNHKKRKNRYQKEYQFGIQSDQIHENSEQNNNNNNYNQHNDNDNENDSKRKYLSNGIIADFSIIKNYKELISLPTQDPNLAIFSGIRTFAFLMVIYGHTNQMIASSTYQLEIARIMDNWQFIWLADMLYSVDVFFWLGGFFLGFILCESKKSRQISSNPMGVFYIILHRLLRIWPSYIVAMMINSYLAPFVGSGPRWFSSLPSFECQGGAWRNLLFIDNWFEDFKLCFGWGWYLTNDFQLFLVSLIPIVFYALQYKKTSKILIILLIIGTLIVGLAISIHYKYYIPVKALFVLSCYYNYYVKPYCRAPPYLLGLLLGIVYREYKTTQTLKIGRSYLSQFNDFIKVKSQRYLFQFGMYLLGFTIIGWLLLGWRPVQLNSDSWSELFQEIYHAFCRIFFVFGVTLLALVNMVGIKDFFNTTFMNCVAFRFMAKISFSCYLVHLIIILITNATFYQAPEFTYISNFYTFFGNLGLTIIAAVLLTLLVEIPFGKLETRLMKKLTMKEKQNTLLK